MSFAGHKYEVDKVGFFAGIGATIPFAPGGPEYAPGTAASFGDPKIGEETYSAAFFGGATYTIKLGSKGEALGLYLGPSLALDSTYEEFNDPTGILEDGTGSYFEEPDTETSLGATFGFHFLTGSSYAVGLGYDSALKLTSLNIAYRL
jgi:hypothetical protein